MLLSPVVGVFYPLDVLPPWLRAIGHALPPSYVFENMRAVVAGSGASAEDLAIAVALALGPAARLLDLRAHPSPRAGPPA